MSGVLNNLRGNPDRTIFFLVTGRYTRCILQQYDFQCIVLGQK